MKHVSLETICHTLMVVSMVLSAVIFTLFLPVAIYFFRKGNKLKKMVQHEKALRQEGFRLSRVINDPRLSNHGHLDLSGIPEFGFDGDRYRTSEVFGLKV